MLDSLLDRIGDWNPQLFRELKSRLTIRSVAIVVAIVLLTQGLILLASYLNLHNNIPPYPSMNEIADYYGYRAYCTGAKTSDDLFRCVLGTDGKLQINWDVWWQTVYFQTFTWLTGTIGAVLLIGGSFLLTSDLVREGRRDTLNFIRLSPQSATVVLVGKVLGVPVLVYLATIVALPFHLWLGMASHIAILNILGFYAVLLGCCATFYSLSLLAGLLSSPLSGFQPWLCSGGILGFQVWMIAEQSADSLMVKTPAAWAQFFSPAGFWQLLLNHPPAALQDVQNLQYLQWFFLPVGSSAIGLLALTAVNSAVCTYGIWQVVVRRFHNPQVTLLSKRQSYWLVFGVNLMLIGFTLQWVLDYDYSTLFKHGTEYGFMTFGTLAGCNLVMLLGLMAVLTPQRPVLQEWARYRHQHSSMSLLQELVWGEKSPAIVAIAINLAIASLLLLPWVLPSLETPNAVIRTLFAMAFLVMILLICATIVQFALLMKTKKRSLWAIGSIAAIVILPPILLSSADASTDPEWFMLSSFPWYGISHASITTLVQTLLGQVAIFTWLNLRLTRQLKRLGSSEFLVRSAELGVK